MHRTCQHEVDNIFQESGPMRSLHRERAAGHACRQIIQPISICVFCVHRASFALKSSFSISPADDCGRVDVPVMHQMCNAFAALESSQGQSGQNLCAEMLVRHAGTLPPLWPVPWTKLVFANVAHLNGGAASSGIN